MKTQVLLDSDAYLDMLIELLLDYLSTGWVVLVYIGNLAALFLIALGCLLWLSGWETAKGRRLVIGGILLFIVMQWMAFSPPWIGLLAR